MGNPSSNSPSPSIRHFSHPHPLELQLSNPNQTEAKISCSGCKFKASGTFYTCKPCNYILHISCAKMAHQITHPCDPNHPLSLLPFPANPDGIFNCKACDRTGHGFFYHCQACNIDVHTLCALMPLSINHQSHHHLLILAFSPPYPSKSFSCDICQQMGSNHWLYRCSLCEFDAHLGCARIRPQTPIQTQPIHQETVAGIPIPQYQPGPSFVPAYMPPSLNNPNQVVFGAAVPNQGNVQQGNGGLLSSLLQNALGDAAQQLGGTLLQGIMGGGGGGGGNGGVGDFGAQFLSSFGNYGGSGN